MEVVEGRGGGWVVKAVREKDGGETVREEG